MPVSEVFLSHRYHVTVNVLEVRRWTTLTGFPDSKVHGANIGPTWVLSAPDGPMLAPWYLLSGLFMIGRFVPLTMITLYAVVLSPVLSPYCFRERGFFFNIPLLCIGFIFTSLTYWFVLNDQHYLLTCFFHTTRRITFIIAMFWNATYLTPKYSIKIFQSLQKYALHCTIMWLVINKVQQMLLCIDCYIFPSALLPTNNWIQIHHVRYFFLQCHVHLGHVY